MFSCSLYIAEIQQCIHPNVSSSNIPLHLCSQPVLAGTLIHHSHLLYKYNCSRSNLERSDLTWCCCFLSQPGAFDLVGYVIYDVEGKPYQSVFYNGTIEVVESGGLLSGESVFLITLGIGLLLLLGLWAYSQVQRLTKVNHWISFSDKSFVQLNIHLRISSFTRKPKRCPKWK